MRTGAMKFKGFGATGVFIAGFVALILSTSFALADRRVALVLGNSAYKNPALELANPRDDAQDVAAALRGLGFEVQLEIDADIATSNKALQQFTRSAVGADAALFYFAGHAIQYLGQNFLLPVDADIKDDISLPFETISVENIRALLDRSDGVKIVVLDACRNNPVAERLAKIVSASPPVVVGDRGRGLQRIDKIEGLLVAYAAAPGEVALDGEGRNSPFTKAFLRRLKEPGLEIEMMFRRVAGDVNAETGGRQRPETYVSLVGEYYLNQNDKIAWEKLRATEDPAALRDFIEHFPSSFYSVEARYRLKALERAIADEKARGGSSLAADDDACHRDSTILEGTEDVARLRSLMQATPCDAVKTAAAARIQDIEASLERDADTGSAQKEIDAASRAADVNRPLQIAALQTELRRLGCFDGNESGTLDAKTEQALSRYLEKRGRPAISEIKIDDQVLADLKEQKASVCVAPVIARPEPQNGRFKRPKRIDALARRPQPDQAVSLAPPPKPPRVRPPVAVRAPAREASQPRPQAEPSSSPPSAQNSANAGAHPNGGAAPMGVGF
ncbi:hypothetical protein CU048_06290 [Beijerinckiaceae bacterium]|nr:hypothetical protein CU048_06290 [Beijerinckiaceae bacterium]